MYPLVPGTQCQVHGTWHLDPGSPRWCAASSKLYINTLLIPGFSTRGLLIYDMPASAIIFADEREVLNLYDKYSFYKQLLTKKEEPPDAALAYRLS